MIDTELVKHEGHPDVGLQVFEYLDEILKYKIDKGLPDKWVRNYELGKNKHWRNKSKKVGLLTANLLDTHREKTVNMLTDNNPTFNIAKLDDPDKRLQDAVDNLLDTCQWWWNEYEQQNVFEESVHNGETYGITIEKTLFNPDLEVGKGEVETETIDPFYFGVFPTSIRDIQKAEAVYHFYPVSVREARRRFPDYAEKIIADSELYSSIGDTRNEVAYTNSNNKGMLDRFKNVMKSVVGMLEKTGNDDSVLLVECWLKDYTMIEDKETGFSMPKYPGFIRCITACNGGNIVVSDKPNPSINPMLPDKEARQTYLYDKYPFAYANSKKDTTNIWGMSDFEQLESMQVEINKTLSQITLYKDKASRLKVINPKDSGVPNEHFTNYPSVLNPSNSVVANGIRYMESPPLPGDLYNVMSMYKDFFFTISGGFDMEQAQAQGKQVIAYKAIAALIERASLMMKGKIRAYSRLIRERGRMYLSHVMNWYDDERWITYKNRDGEERVKSISGRELIIPVRLSVVTGSTMPVSQVQEREEAIELYKMGAIDEEELLKKMDWSDYKGVVKRMELGVLGGFMSKLQELGFPQSMLDVMEKVSEMHDDKEFEANVQGGVIPTYDEISKMAQGEGESGEPMSPEAKKDIADSQKNEAEVRKILAEAALTEEKIVSEKMEQYVRESGVKFDSEKLRMERAKVASEIKGKFSSITGKNQKPESEERGTEPYREKGLKSNNENV